MEIQAFGYLGVGSDKVEDWSAFAPAWLGMQEVDQRRRDARVPHG